MTPEEFELHNPAFVYRNKDVMGLEAELQVGHPADKNHSLTVLTLRTNNISGYNMAVTVQGGYGSQWSEPIDVGAISITLRGDYERQILIAFLQKVGLLTIPVFGKYETGPFESD
jgi:hypothetical protein